MKRKIFAVIAALILLSNSGAVMAENQVSPDLSWPLPAAEGEIGFTTVDQILGQNYGYSRLFVWDGSKEIPCINATDSFCSTFPWKYGIQLKQVFPLCSQAPASQDCIVGVEVSDGKVSKPAQFIRNLPYPRFDANPDLNIPLGGQPSLWSNPFSNDPTTGLLVSASGDMRKELPDIATAPYSMRSFTAGIVSYQEKNGDYQPITVIPPVPTNTFSSFDTTQVPVECAWSDKGLCGVSTAFPGIKTITLKLRLQNNLTGWLAGRLDEPTISVTKFSDTQNILSVTGKPSVVAQVSAHTLAASATQEMKDLSVQNLGDEYASFRIDKLVPLLNAYKAITKDTATKLIPTWSFNDGFGPSTNNCLKSSNEFVGLVTTNATALQFEPPSFENGSLNYVIAAPHFQPTGQPYEGTYSLNIKSTAARCLYNFTNAPISATVTVLNEGGDTAITTSALTESDGWLKLNISGIHFSNPTIRIQLKQEVVAPTPSASATPTPTTVAGKKLLSITCVKGKLTKIVKALHPTCPKGYKKK